MVYRFSFFLIAPVLAFSQINYDTLSENSWMQMRPGNQFPSRGGDVLGAIDTSGNFYMIGGCTYGNSAGGTHNNDIFRVNLNTGKDTLLANCGQNVWGWAGGCQAGHAYDPSRNCVWISGGAAAVCSGQSGLWKFQCPSGPFTRIAGDAGGKFLMYDNVNDLLYKADQYKLNIFDCKAGQWLASVNYPFSLGWEIDTWMVSCCFDTKRGLCVITMNGAIPNGTPRNDIYTYNGATQQWLTKTPPSKPPFNQGSLSYDPLNDLYVYFGGGTCPAQLWTYSPDANLWTEAPASGRAYNDANPAASTWPPYRTQNTWNYSPRHNAFFTWGTTEWLSDKSCFDDGFAMPFWVYRPASQGTGIGRTNLLPRPGALELSILSNPFSAGTDIRFALSGKSGTTHAKLSVLNSQGRLVSILADGNLSPGAHTEKWNASREPSGVYLFRLESGSRISVKRGIKLDR